MKQKKVPRGRNGGRKKLKIKTKVFYKRVPESKYEIVKETVNKIINGT